MMKSLNYIHPEAKIGKDVTIEPFATIGRGVKIGDGTWVGPNAVIMEGATIGKNCKIFPGAVISAIPQDLKFKGEASTVEIGDNVIIREYVTINRGTLDKYKTSVGDNSLLMAYVHVAHDCVLGKNCILANNVALAGHVEIEDFVVLEGLVAVQQFVKLGAHAFVGGASLIRKNVPPYVKAAREPLSYAGINSIGLRRRGFSNETILNIEDIYRIIYVRSNNISQALNAVELEVPASDEKQNIIKFIRESTKGIIRGPSLS
ncbi:MAG TPA: acyl-ACP--UDP-N-acetylglucosamine O-acyltransferase [Flavobacteriales bacterium]|nr:acyl-ACP--UDP-N-acetylglucosamine O-acyltransferase [Flavobacteriales bacterium]HIN39705.1 acyl-ACP--UDP-N-acetylglucosamine O-acyltransferase [Flavobacteriales bacterium]